MSALSLSLILPFIASGALFLFSYFSKANTKGLAFIISLSTFVILITTQQSILADSIRMPWFEPLSIEFYLKVDSLSLIFLYVTAIIVPIAILSVKTSSSLIYALILFLQGLLLIFFTARDLAVFTIFFEATLLPLYFIMTLNGSENAKKAAIKFIVYMIAGSCLMVAAVLSLYFSFSLHYGFGSFNLDALKAIGDTLPHAGVLFAIFLLAFAVKTPMFPFHGWLADAYTEASITGTILLSAVLSKLGIYGLFRIVLELFPSQVDAWQSYLTPLAIFGVLYGGLIAWTQNDYKRMIAYSSFSHVNFILAGIFVFSEVARKGALLQVLNHAVTITGLFLVAEFLYDRIHTRALINYRGLVKYLPRLCWISLIFVLASVALPGTNNFIGDILILFGLFEQSFIKAAILGLSTILSAIYLLRYMELNFFGKDPVFENTFIDIGKKEILLLLPLMILIFLVGLYPDVVLKQLETLR